jgi:glycosyltransferase involved in cell wall biosynthesis
MAVPELFVGITSWESELFLGHCIDAVHKTTDSARTKVAVIDNNSSDKSRELAEDRGIRAINRKCSQPDALNYLFNMSNCKYTLLIHADVILLSDRWFDICKAHLHDNIAMISPEDIGCGPYTRPWGKNMPESSFMLFRTKLVSSSRRWFRKQRFKIRWPYRAIDFYGPHVTHNLPEMLKKSGLGWEMMKVHTSTLEAAEIYRPNFKPKYWWKSFGDYRYGLGNFYSIDNHITHYHNWFDRIAKDSFQVDDNSCETYPREDGLPLAYVKAYTSKFLGDLINNQLVIPKIAGEKD